MSEKNLGSVVGLTLKNFERQETVTSNLDEKGRIIINTDPLVSGYKFILIKINKTEKTYNIPIYPINRDFVSGFITLITANEDGSASNYLRCVLPTPFNYAIKTDGIAEVTIYENGQILN